LIDPVSTAEAAEFAVAKKILKMVQDWLAKTDSTIVVA
jgi:hypothetical protein